MITGSIAGDSLSGFKLAMLLFPFQPDWLLSTLTPVTWDVDVTWLTLLIFPDLNFFTALQGGKPSS